MGKGHFLTALSGRTNLNLSGESCDIEGPLVI